MKKLCLFIFSLLLIFSAGCQLDTSEIDRKTELEYITVDTSKAQTEYYKGELFKKDGFRIIGHYSNGIEKEEDINLADFPEVDTSEINSEVVVSVTYKDLVGKFVIDVVDASPQRILIKNYPIKLFYKPREEIDLTGLEAVIVYSDGTVSEVLDENSFTFSGNTDIDNEIPIIINLSYKQDESVKTSFNAFISRSEVIDLSFISNLRTTYMEGEEIASNIVMYTLASTSSQMFTLKNCHIEPSSIEKLEQGEYEITAKLNGKEVSNKITIVSGYVVGADSEIKYRQYFYDGNIIDFTDSNFFVFNETSSNTESIGVNIVSDSEKKGNLKYSYKTKVDYNDAKPITDKLTLDGTGIQNIYFYYKFNSVVDNTEHIHEWTESISVFDAKLDSITATYISNANIGIPLEEKPTLSFENKYGRWEIRGMTSKKTGSTIDIPPENCKFEFTDYSNSENSNEKEVRIIYYDSRNEEELKTTTKIIYSDAIITGVRISTFPTKKSYFVGEELDLTGLSATLYYSDGTDAPLPDDAIQSNSLSNNKIADDTKEVNLFFTDVTNTADKNAVYVTIPVEVIGEKIDHIEISPKKEYASNLKFRKGKAYDFSTYFDVNSVNNKGTKTSLNSGFQFNLVSKTGTEGTLYVVCTIGEKSYSASYTGTGDNKIVLLSPEPLSITYTAPEKYSLFDDYVNDSKYKVYYKDGTSEEFASLKKLEDAGFSYNSINSSDLTITINYSLEKDCGDTETKNVSIPIDFSQILKNISNIKIEKKNSQNNYVRGKTSPQKDDFILKAYYSESKFWVINDYVFECDTKGDIDPFITFSQPISVKYHGFSDTCNVDIIPQITGLALLVGNEVITSSKTYTKNNSETKDIKWNSLSNQFKYRITIKNSQNSSDSIDLDEDNLQKYGVIKHIGDWDKNSRTITISCLDKQITITITIN